MLNYKRSAFQSICEPVTFSGLSYYWIKFVPTSCIDSVYSKDVHDIFLSRYIEFSLCYCPLMKFLGFYTPTNEVGGGVILDSPCPSICPSVHHKILFFFPLELWPFIAFIIIQVSTGLSWSIVCNKEQFTGKELLRDIHDP